MTNSSVPRHHQSFLQMGIGEFWSGDLGLTLLSISLLILIFVIFPLREAGIPGRIFFDLTIVTLMIMGTFAVPQSRTMTILTIVTVLAAIIALIAGRLHPVPSLHELGSLLSTMALLIYIRVVLLIMFRAGRITWSRMQGGVCAYLLIGLAWGSAYELLEELSPGSFHFVSSPESIDQLTAKLTYFSFSTLTTVGFGDVTPLQPFARSMAIAEAITGQLFPAILIGALVAMAIQSAAKS